MQEDLINKIYQELNLTPIELAKELNVSDSAVSQWKTRGIPKDKKRIMELMLELHEKEKMLKTIADYHKTIEKLTLN